MAKAAAEGVLVNIPAHRLEYTDVVTKKINLSALMVWHSCVKKRHAGKSACLPSMAIFRREKRFGFTESIQANSLPRKPSNVHPNGSVP